MLRHLTAKYYALNRFAPLFLLSGLLLACETPTSKTTSGTTVDLAATAPARPPRTQSRSAPAKVFDPEVVAILNRAIIAHGADGYADAHYEFVFRDKTYTLQTDESDYVYTRQFMLNGQPVIEELKNGNFRRLTNGQLTPLSAKDSVVASNALNSVIYFATLPDKLRDPAVNLLPLPNVTINNRAYDAFGVNFDEEGGGKDHDDNYVYWVNRQTDRIDYLAYDYRVDGGGVRFRAAYNPRTVDGVLFQDYVNYKAPIGTALTELPALYAAGKLEELSRIDTEAVRNLKTR